MPKYWIHHKNQEESTGMNQYQDYVDFFLFIDFFNANGIMNKEFFRCGQMALSAKPGASHKFSNSFIWNWAKKRLKA